MPCYSYLHGFEARSKTADKKRTITFRPSSSIRQKPIDLPCGQCIGCRLERSRQWAVRCMHEASLYTDNAFITLTYNDQNIPPNGTLVKEHFQKFMKRLRKSIAPKPVRYYHCGEYGEKLQRPHYHALLFGHDFEDKKFFSSKNNNSVYTSDSLSKLWPYGFSVSGAVTFDSAAYVARYVMKKVTGARAIEHYQGRIPEYTTMSRRPGIGKGWYEKYKTDVYPLDRVVVRGNSTRPPRFYDYLLGLEDRAQFELIKIQREEKNGRHFVTDRLSDGSTIRVSDNDFGRLLIKEEVKKAQIQNLVRPLED